ncbi:MAG: HIT family protein [Candidatus Paceibacterota bacterium]
MEDCVFCKIYEEKEGIIYENDFFYAQFDIYPVSPGHAELIPIRHVASFTDLKDKESRLLSSSIADIIELIETEDLKEFYQNIIENPLDERSKEFCEEVLAHSKVGQEPDGYNIGINEGQAAGRTIDHLHIHIIPRYSGDVNNPVGGVRNIIPGKGNYKD